VSFGFGGSVPNGDSMNPMISADGRSVVFESVATNLTVSAVPGSQPLSRIFVRDLQSGQILQVTPGQGALLPPNGDSTRPSISGDGRFVAFESTATNLVGQGGTGSAGRNIFVWDRQSGQTTLVTAAAAGSSSPSADGDSLNPSISADGRFVAFKSRATNLTTSPSGGMASPGNLNVFVHDLQSGATTLVGVAGTGSTTGTVGSPGATDDNGSQDPVLSRDGTWVAFTQTSSSSSPSVSQVFLTNRITGQIQQVSGLPIGSSSTSGTTTGTTTTTTGSTTGTTSGTTGGTTSSAPTFRGLTR
jgi:hypothetical protein